MSKTIELLSRQHQEVLARLATVESGLETGSNDAASFAAFLQGEVGEHFRIEEQALFPFLARHLNQRYGPLAVMNAEHASFREQLRRLCSAVSAGVGAIQDACIRDILDLLRSHIFKEDNVLFPMALQVLDADELREVDARAAALAVVHAAEA